MNIFEKNQYNKKEERVPKIVLTGGPCGGKTTALNYLGKRLKDFGFRCALVPEVGSIIIQAALLPNVIHPLGYKPFEKAYIKTQIFWEELFEKMISEVNGDKKIIICDRGITDIAAYMSQKDFKKIIKSHGLDSRKLRDRNYNLVIHLVTAADGAEKFYNFDNLARYETTEEAREIDKKILKVWQGHPNLKVVDNSTDFEQKMEKVLNIVCDTLGIS